jgi:uncharacterized protein DUF5907
MDYTNTLPQISPSQASHEVTANENFAMMSGAALFARKAETSSGLTWGFQGGRFDGTLVADDDVTLTASNTNYIVVHRSTLVVSVSTTNTNWNDSATYGRAYLVTVGASAPSDWEDHRAGDGGILQPVGLSPTGSAGGDLTGTYPNPTVANDAVTFAKMQNIATAKLLGRSTSGSGDVEEIGVSTGLQLSASGLAANIIPQNSQSTAYTTVLGDAGKHLLHPSADTSARTFTIDSNANVAYPIGTAITFVNQDSAGTLTIAITSDTMRLAGAGTTGSRTLAANGIATALKVTSTEWIISGTGLT